MLIIDGSYGEGGGQILRTSVALSALTNTPIKITNIRARRENPGLRAQHLSAIKAVAMLCDAKVKNLAIGSREIEFIPGNISNKKFSIDIGTAGSISLVLQALSIASIFNDVEVEIIGGTDVRNAPTVDYLQNVLFPILKIFGGNSEIKILRRGYYPRGNGQIVVKFRKANLKEISLTERGKILEIYGFSNASFDLKKRNVAERQKNASKKILEKFNVPINIKEEYCHTSSLGSAITLIAKTENSFIGACSVGEPRKTSEDVGEECAKNLIYELEKQEPVDSHLLDQIIPYIAIAKGNLKAKELTMHAKTNLYIVNLFGFDVKHDGKFIYSK